MNKVVELCASARSIVGAGRREAEHFEHPAVGCGQFVSPKQTFPNNKINRMSVARVYLGSAGLALALWAALACLAQTAVFHVSLVAVALRQTSSFTLSSTGLGAATLAGILLIRFVSLCLRLASLDGERSRSY